MADGPWNNYQSQGAPWQRYGTQVKNPPPSYPYEGPQAAATLQGTPATPGASLPQVTVTASAPYADLGMLSFLGLGSITLTVSHREMKVS